MGGAILGIEQESTGEGGAGQSSKCSGRHPKVRSKAVGQTLGESSGKHPEGGVEQPGKHHGEEGGGRRRRGEEMGEG